MIESETWRQSKRTVDMHMTVHGVAKYRRSGSAVIAAAGLLAKTRARHGHCQPSPTEQHVSQTRNPDDCHMDDP